MKIQALLINLRLCARLQSEPSPYHSHDGADNGCSSFQPWSEILVNGIWKIGNLIFCVITCRLLARASSNKIQN
jgi:hypothetical protein